MSAITFTRRSRALVVVVALLAGLTVTSNRPAEARDIALILDYTVAATCPVYPNYPKEGVIGNQIGWTIAPGDIVAWRYNVNDNWSMISDAKYRGSSTHPWWGITPKACIGTSVGGEPFPTPTSSYPAGRPVPNRILEGRSAVEADHYRTVYFHTARAGNEVDPYRLIRSKGTLRDAPNNFVIGNVNAGWHVHTTDLRSQGWTYCWVNNAQRWGWIQDIHL